LTIPWVSKFIEVKSILIIGPTVFFFFLVANNKNKKQEQINGAQILY